VRRWNSLTDAQPIAGYKPQDGIVTFPHKSRSIGRGQHLLNVFPLDRMRKSIQLSREQHGNRIDETSFQQSRHMGKAQKTAQRRYKVFT
jgi:hypothetical protein